MVRSAEASAKQFLEAVRDHVMAGGALRLRAARQTLPSSAPSSTTTTTTTPAAAVEAAAAATTTFAPLSPAAAVSARDTPPRPK